MAEQQQKPTTEQPPASESAQADATAQAQTPQKDEARYTQSEVDRRVREALKKREDNLSAEKAAALKKAEQDAALARGEFDTVRKQIEAERDAAMRRAHALAVTHELKVAALQAGINDPDDVRLLGDDALASLSDDKGTISREAVLKAVETLKTTKSYLFKQATQAAQPSPEFRGQATSGNAVPPLPTGDVTAEQILKARMSRQNASKNPNQPSINDVIRETLSRR